MQMRVSGRLDRTSCPSLCMRKKKSKQCKRRHLPRTSADYCDAIKSGIIICRSESPSWHMIWKIRRVGCWNKNHGFDLGRGSLCMFKEMLSLENFIFFLFILTLDFSWQEACPVLHSFFCLAFFMTNRNLLCNLRSGKRWFQLRILT